MRWPWLLLLLAACRAPAPPAPDLSHWKLELPIENPSEVEPPELARLARNGALKPYFYLKADGTLVFFTRPGRTTPHSHYARTELREELVPGRTDVNWTLDQGGRLLARIRLYEISHDAKGRPHRTIVAQIHGRLSREQRERIGADSYDAPPLLKLYWQDGRVRAFLKVLKNLSADDTEILKKDAWTDEKYTFPAPVGPGFFDLAIEARRGRVRVQVNDEVHVFSGLSLKRWPFLSYFKAGNYLQTTDPGAHATVFIQKLSVSHP